jgi:hypothetical protein
MRLANVAKVGLCLLQAGCASHPSSIDARYVSPQTYQSWNCEQLVEERSRLNSEVQRVAGLQRENANADAAMMTVGLILFWPALFGLAATRDRKDELGRLKGEYEAVDQSMKVKLCAPPPPPVTPAGDVTSVSTPAPAPASTASQ